MTASLFAEPISPPEPRLSPLELRQELSRRGVRLERVGDRLRCLGVPGAIGDLAPEIAAQKAALLQLIVLDEPAAIEALGPSESPSIAPAPLSIPRPPQELNAADVARAGWRLKVKRPGLFNTMNPRQRHAYAIALACLDAGLEIPREWEKSGD